MEQGYKHVQQYKAMRKYTDEKIAIARKLETKGVDWNENIIVNVCDYSQNMGVPHFGSEQPGDTYYFSPLGVYIFGICSKAKLRDNLFVYYYYEGDAKKGGNNVSSLLWRKIQQEKIPENFDNLGPLKEYVLVMDNCGGQNKNRMVIRLFLALTEIGFFNHCELLFLVRGHTKNTCDRMFTFLKKTFHYSNIYTHEQVHSNFNQSDYVTAERATTDYFFDMDSFLDNYYKNLESGSVNRSHVFIMNHTQPGVIILKDHDGAEERIQCLLKGPPIGEGRRKGLRQHLEEGLVKLKPPGIQPIKKIELAKKWGPLVPKEYRYAFCKPAGESDINQVKALNRDKRKKSVNKKKQLKQPTNDDRLSAQADIPTVNQAQPPIVAGGKRVCSVCKQPGHNKRTCPNKNALSAEANKTKNNKEKTTANESREEQNSENALRQDVVDI